MNRTAKRQNQKQNYTQKNRKLRENKNNCKYKSCKSKMYQSIYGGRYITNMFI
jgi:hypothetical protein